MVFYDQPASHHEVLRDVDGLYVISSVSFLKFSSLLAMYFFVFMVSVLSCTEHVHRNFSYKLLKLSKSIIDSLVRILFNKI